MTIATNPYRALLAILPQDPLQVATVTAIHTDNTVTVQFPGGNTLRVRGQATPGDRVFIQSSQVTGQAPNLPTITIEI